MLRNHTPQLWPKVAQNIQRQARLLGATRDTEADGVHSSAADADGADEDGVTFGTLQVGVQDVAVTVNVQSAPAGAKLDAWIDFNGDGNWGGPGERVLP